MRGLRSPARVTTSTQSSRPRRVTVRAGPWHAAPMPIEMAERFHPAARSILDGDVDTLRALVDATPALAVDRSEQSHPTLLQMLVLEAKDQPAETQHALADVLVDAGAELDEPLLACGSGGNVAMAGHLLDRGASLEGRPDLVRGWTVLEEALYWGFPELVDHLLARGAAVRNLRAAAGLGRMDDVVACFVDAHTLDVARAGEINWPFGKLPDEHRSREPQDLLDHALCHAAIGGHLEVVKLLLSRGASLAAKPKGFHFRGTTLHWVAIRGLSDVARFLLDRGADPTALDDTFGTTPATWARRGRNEDLARMLEQAGG